MLVVGNYLIFREVPRHYCLMFPRSVMPKDPNVGMNLPAAHSPRYLLIENFHNTTCCELLHIKCKQYQNKFYFDAVEFCDTQT